MNARFLSGFILALSLGAYTADSSLAAIRYTVPKEITDLIASGKVAEARQSLQEFRRTNPDNTMAIYYLAQVEEDRNLALALLKEVELLAEPNLASEAQYTRAEMLFNEGDHSGAEALFLKNISDHPSGPRYADALYRLGTIRLMNGKPDEAILQFSKSREAQKDDFKKTLAAAGIMECHVAKKDWNGVLDAARETMEGEDDTSALTPRVLEVIALAWHELGNEENSAKFTQRLLTTFPRSYQAHMLRVKGETAAGASAWSLGNGGGSADSARSTLHAGTAAGDTGKTGIAAPTGDDSLSGIDGQFSIQMAALEVRINALKLYNKLKDAGFPARIEMKTVGDEHRYLVRVGAFNSRTAADSMAVRIAKNTGLKGSVIILK